MCSFTLKFVSLPTSDYEKAIDFWVNKMNYIKVKDCLCSCEDRASSTPVSGTPTETKPTNGRWIELAPPGGTGPMFILSIMPPCELQEREGESTEASMRRRFRASFECENIATVYEELRAKGVKFTTAPTFKSWGGYATFEDMDSNLFCLCTTKSHNGHNAAVETPASQPTSSQQA